MKCDPHQIKILHGALNAFGLDNQVTKAIEELAELIKELCLFKAGSARDRKRHNVEEELADAIIMIEQMLIVFNQYDEVTRQVRYKMNRLEARLMEKK